MNFNGHVFLSDVHLGAFSASTNAKIEENLIKLIAYCADQNYALYVLGDLFDYWMEYPDKNFVPDIGVAALDAFEEYNTNIAPTVYITGNHDNWTFGHFEDRGFSVETNFKMLKLGDKKALLMHGDGVSANALDFPRAAFHRFLRHSKFVSLYQRVMPPKTGLNTMKLFSSLTRRRNDHNPNPLNRKAKQLLQDHSIDYIVCGHDHVARMETFSDGIYINTGMFYEHYTIATYNNSEGFKLVVWQADENKFIPYLDLKNNTP